MKPKVGVVSDDSPLHVSWLWPWPSLALFLIHAFTPPLFFPTRSPIFCPYLSLLLESLQWFSIRLGDKAHPLYPAVLVTPVFHSCQSCGPCSCTKHAASLPGSFLLSYSVPSPRGDWSPQEGSTMVYSFTPAQCFAKSTCSSTVQSPCLAGHLSFPTLQAQLPLALTSGWALGLDPAALVCPISVSLGPTDPPLSGRFRPVPVLSNSDEGRTCWETASTLVTSLLGVRQTWARGPGVLGASCVTLGKCIHRSVCVFHHLKTGDVSDAGFPRRLRTTCGYASAAPSRMPGTPGGWPR